MHRSAVCVNLSLGTFSSLDNLRPARGADGAKAHAIDPNGMDSWDLFRVLEAKLCPVISSGEGCGARPRKAISIHKFGEDFDAQSRSGSTMTDGLAAGSRLILIR